MNEKILIRKAILNDVESIYKFICALENTVFDFDLFVTLFNENLKNKKNLYFVAEEINQSKIVGYISCHGQTLLHHLGLVYEIQECVCGRIKKKYRYLVKLLFNFLGRKFLPEIVNPWK
jgi:PhnO protein